MAVSLEAGNITRAPALTGPSKLVAPFEHRAPLRHIALTASTIDSDAPQLQFASYLPGRLFPRPAEKRSLASTTSRDDPGKAFTVTRS
jgi:hypothetical protein